MAGGKGLPPYSFLGQSYQDIPSLVAALASNWKEGKQQLYRGLLSAFFKGCQPELAGYCIDAEEEATQTAGKDDLIFWNLLYKLDPEMHGFYWMGQRYESLPALGRDMLERLWKNDRSNMRYWDSILDQQLLTHYLATVKAQNATLSAAVSALETAHSLRRRNKRTALLNYYTMAYLLSGQTLFSIGDKRLKSVSELTAHMQALLDSSYEAFEDFCHTLIDYDDNLDVQFEAWLIALGKRKEIKAWRDNLHT